MHEALVTTIPGLQYVPAYLPPQIQSRLIEILDRQPWRTDLRRRVQHYGYRYDYKAHTVDSSMYLGPLPRWAARIASRVHQDGFSPQIPDQVIVNEYEPGQGISPHIDCVPCFGDTILSLSLGSACVMQLTHRQSGLTIPLLLEPGSLLVMRGEARYDWTHGIAARKTDCYQGQTLRRGRRLSLTLRTVMLQEQSLASR